MKTITLNDAAYDRLKSWKSGDSDSFSKVVLRVVPKRGTAADMEGAFGQLKPLSDGDAEEILAALPWANKWSGEKEPWGPETMKDARHAR